MIKEEVIKKYVKGLDGLLQEIQQDDLFESEASVIFYFGRIYKYLNLYGFMIKDEKKGELDAIAYLDPQAKKEINIEFELRSKNFVNHGHDPNKCDLIVCWKHNWKECPDHIDVLELDYLWKKRSTRYRHKSVKSLSSYHT